MHIRALRKSLTCLLSTCISELHYERPLVTLFHSLPTFSRVVSSLRSRRNMDALGYSHKLERSTCMPFGGTGSNQIHPCRFHLYFCLSQLHFRHLAPNLRIILLCCRAFPVRCSTSLQCDADRIPFFIFWYSSIFQGFAFRLAQHWFASLQPAGRILSECRVPGK